MTSSGMIGKDEFGNLCLRERKKGGERLCICRYEVISFVV